MLGSLIAQQDFHRKLFLLAFEVLISIHVHIYIYIQYRDWVGSLRLMYINRLIITEWTPKNQSMKNLDSIRKFYFDLGPTRYLRLRDTIIGSIG